MAGYGRPPGRSLTPTLDALAKRGAYFRRAWSEAPNTPRSFPSILTSRYPSDIAWDKPTVNYPNLLPSNVTFFEGLAAAGWKNIGIFSHFYFTADRGISKSFAEWSDDGAGTIAESNKDIASPRIVPRVIDRLRKAAAHKERFALWTHLFEPHSSYMTHPEFPPRLSGVPGLIEKYDYEIAYVDLWLKKLFAALDQLGLADDTAVVVMADHGEAFGEHKIFFHGQDLFDEQLRVPLIIAIPGQTPRVFEDQVSLVDVGPTLLDLVGAPIPPSFRGKSLLPRIRGDERPPRPIFSELMPATAWPHHAVDDGRRQVQGHSPHQRPPLGDVRSRQRPGRTPQSGRGAAAPRDVRIAPWQAGALRGAQAMSHGPPETPRLTVDAIIEILPNSPAGGPAGLHDGGAASFSCAASSRRSAGRCPAASSTSARPWPRRRGARRSRRPASTSRSPSCWASTRTPSAIRAAFTPWAWSSSRARAASRRAATTLPRRASSPSTRCRPTSPSITR